MWEAGGARLPEGSPQLAGWVRTQEDRLYKDNGAEVVRALRAWLMETPKTGPGNKGRRKRITDAIRYLEGRLEKLCYGTYRKRDLEVGTGQVECAIKYVIAKRCDHGGMRWIRRRAQAVIQLRCIDVNGHWEAFIAWTFGRLRAHGTEHGERVRLQSKLASELHCARHAS